MLFGTVPAMAAMALFMLAVVGGLWLLNLRSAATGYRRRTTAVVLDALVWFAATGVLAACTAVPQGSGPHLGTLALAAAFTALTQLHRLAHPRR
ncbi:hypothetical protein [Streptacidiphilus sp. EB103A]|uniref:hypothetical protein n=1 Tax=Streptacidiphilus sp. EB103A TaxID=3156275 RepID=UPI00351448FA